jgi:hypothetical protein
VSTFGGLSSNICWEISENKEGEKGLGVDSGFQGTGKKGGETMWGKKHLSTMSVHFECDHSRLPLILLFGSEPRREVPSIILSDLGTYAFP